MSYTIFVSGRHSSSYTTLPTSPILHSYSAKHCSPEVADGHEVLPLRVARLFRLWLQSIAFDEEGCVLQLFSSDPVDLRQELDFHW